MKTWQRYVDSISISFNYD